MGQEYAEARSKGCTLWSMMNSDDADAGKMFTPPRASVHSDYLQLEDLTKWAYITKAAKSGPKCEMGNSKDMYGLETILRAKRISTDKRDWKCVKITHGDSTADIDSQTYTNPRTGKTVRVTGALFQFAMNERDGVLIIAKRYGPAHQAQYRHPPVEVEDFPDLRSSSDIAWLAWKPHHDKGVILKHIITWSVANGGTQRLLAAALEDMPEGPVDKTLQPYPWVWWRPNEHPGGLVLGSPNGVGVGFMLVQHKAELGNRRVRKIEAFLADTAASYLREPSLY